MQVSQRTIKMRTHPENTLKLYDLLSKNLDFNNTSSGSVSQKVVKSRTRSDGKSKGVAIRRK